MKSKQFAVWYIDRKGKEHISRPFRTPALACQWAEKHESKFSPDLMMAEGWRILSKSEKSYMAII